MRCLTCQHVNEANARFCAGCGSQLSRVCPGCGNPCAPGARFCASCGLNLEQSLTGDPSDRLNALTSQAAVVGERKLVTVLFADIVDSTHLIEDLEPDEADTQLRAIIEAMRDAVRR